MNKLAVFCLALFIGVMEGCGNTAHSSLSESGWSRGLPVQGERLPAGAMESFAPVWSQQLFKQPPRPSQGGGQDDAQFTGQEQQEDMLRVQQSTLEEQQVDPGEQQGDLEEQQEDFSGIPTVLIHLYYQDQSGLLLPVTREVPKQEGIARTSINGLIDSSATREELQYYGLYPVLPQGTLVQGITIREGTARIDFNSNVLNAAGEKDEKNIIRAIVFTLTEFDSIKQVSIMVDGRPLERLKSGEMLPNPLSRQMLLINHDKLVREGGDAKAELYFIKDHRGRYLYYVPFSKTVKAVQAQQGINEAQDRERMARAVYEALDGGTGEGHTAVNAIPAGTRLLNVQIRGERLTLNYSSTIKSTLGNADTGRRVLNQILYSARQLQGITSIAILVEGKQVLLPDGTDLSRAVSVPGAINQVVP